MFYSKVGYRLAWTATIVVRDEPARHENQFIVSCLGQRLDPRAREAWPARHDVPSQPGCYQAVPARYRVMPRQAGSLPIIRYRVHASIVFLVLFSSPQKTKNFSKFLVTSNLAANA